MRIHAKVIGLILGIFACCAIVVGWSYMATAAQLQQFGVNPPPAAACDSLTQCKSLTTFIVAKIREVIGQQEPAVYFRTVKSVMQCKPDGRRYVCINDPAIPHDEGDLCDENDDDLWWNYHVKVQNVFVDGDAVSAAWMNNPQGPHADGVPLQPMDVRLVVVCADSSRVYE